MKQRVVVVLACASLFGGCSPKPTKIAVKVTLSRCVGFDMAWMRVRRRGVELPIKRTKTELTACELDVEASVPEGEGLADALTFEGKTICGRTTGSIVCTFGTKGDDWRTLEAAERKLRRSPNPSTTCIVTKVDVPEDAPTRTATFWVDNRDAPDTTLQIQEGDLLTTPVTVAAGALTSVQMRAGRCNMPFTVKLGSEVLGVFASPDAGTTYSTAMIDVRGTHCYRYDRIDYGVGMPYAGPGLLLEPMRFRPVELAHVSYLFAAAPRPETMDPGVMESVYELVPVDCPNAPPKGGK
jgi:hypothetical protein